MSFHFRPAPASLASAVRAFWAFDRKQEEGSSEEERVVPDGCAEIVVNFGAPFRERIGARVTAQPRAFFAGQIGAPLWLRPGAQVDVFGVRFEPGGARRLGLPPQWQLADRRIEIEAVLPRGRRASWREALERMALDSGFDRRVALMEYFLRGALEPTAIDATDACVSAIAASGGSIDLAQLAARASLSTRQMQRRFHADVGIGPKLLARIVRFQRVFERCGEDGDWASVALSCGYFDQSHLLRDFRQFAGEPPVAFFQAADSQSGYLGPALISGTPR